LSGIAATLQEAEPGTKVSLMLDDGEEVAGSLVEVSGETVDLGDARRVELNHVKRLRLDFSSAQAD